MDVWKWFRRGAYSVIALVALVVAALGVALLLIDTAMLKRQIETRVEAQAGRELQIEGALDISFYPVLGFEVQDVRLSNAPGFGDEPFVSLKRALLRARVLPLLTGEVVVDTIKLYGLRLNAARDAEGRTNWHDLADTGQPSPDAAADSPAGQTERGANPPAADAGGTPLNLRIDRIEVRDSRLAWSDAVSGQQLVLNDFALRVRSLQWDNPSTVVLEGQLRRGDDPPLAMRAITRLSWDLTTPSVTLDNLDINALSQGGTLPAGLSAQLRGDLHVDGAQGVAQFERVAFRVFGRAVTRGDVTVRFGEDTPSFEGQLEVEPFNPAAVAKAGGWPLHERADGDTLTQASLSLQFAGNTEAVTVESLEGRLDDTAFSGQARARLADTPSVEFSLKADAIDLDRYLPPRGGEDADDGGTSSGGGDDDSVGGDPIAQLPLEALQGIEGRGDLTLGRLQWRGLPMEDIRVQGQLTDGVLDLIRADLRVAGGRVAASGRLDGSDTGRPAARLQAQFSEIQSEPVLAALLDRAPVTGTLDASTRLATTGAILDDWIGALDGDLQARFADGTIAGINIAQRLRVAVARLRDGEEAQAAQERSTDFSSLRVSAAIDDGVMRSDDLDLRTPLLRAGGSGRVDLPQRSLDYTLRLRVTDAAGEQGGRLADLVGTEVPLRFRGQLTSPSIDLALGDALEQRANQEIEQEKQEIEQEKQEAEKKARRELKEEGEKAEKRLERELKGLFE